MKEYTIGETRRLLSQPNGPAGIDLDLAWDSLSRLVLDEGDSAALSAWVRAAKQKKYREQIAGQLSSLGMAGLLQADNPKTRKNAARLCGELKRKEDIEALKQAFQEETVRMVRPSQILALGALGEEEILKAYTVPEASDVTEEKHAREEREALRTALGSLRKVPKHRPKGLPKNRLVELVVPDAMEDTVIRELRSAGLTGKRSAKGRVQTELSSYKALLQVRSWREMLFPLLTFQGPAEQWAQILHKRVEPKLLDLLEKVYEGTAPYAYRIELKAEVDRGRISRRIADALDPDKLINSPSDYETELRIEQHGAYVTVYVKFCTLPDPRFSYRKGAIAASIHPTAAAAVVEWAAPYLKANAKVLDPCCGSGTMLIERAKFDTTDTLFGIDISRQAIRVAEENLEAAGASYKLITKDCTQFTAADKFDEVISNLPFGNRVGDHETNEELYEKLFEKLPGWLSKDGIAILYTMEVRLVHRLLKKHAARLVLKSATRTQAGGLDPGVFIIGIK